jgi:BolA protein
MTVNDHLLKERLETTLNSKVIVADESHLHAGHEGAKSGGKHFRIQISSPRFQGLNTLAKHRLVYDAVADWMVKEIHALSINVVEDH